MPQLPQYTAKLGGGSVGGVSGGRRATEEDFGGGAGFADAGRRIQQGAASFLADAEEDEARKALVASTQIRAKYAKELDEAAISGADLTALKEKMDAELAKVGEGFQTKKGVDTLSLHTSNTHLMYDQQANSIAVQRAWSEARVQGTALVNSIGAILQSNPGYLPQAEQNAKDFVATFKGIRPDQRNDLTDRMVKDVNMSAAMSAARVDPVGTIKRLEAGEWNLEPSQRQTALHAADSYKNVREAAEDREKNRIKQERLDAARVARDGYSQRILSGDMSKKLENEIIRDPVFAHTPEYREHLVTFMRADARRLAGEERKSDPKLKQDLFARIIAPEGTVGKIYSSDAIYEAVQLQNNGGRGLNATDANWLMQLVAGQKDENGRSLMSRLSSLNGNVRQSIQQDPNFVGQPALVSEILNDYNDRVVRKVNEIRKEGKESPDTVFQVGHKNYVGSRTFVQESIDAARQRQRAATAALPKVTTQAEYDALPAGAAYLDSSGKQAVKKGSPNRAAGAIKQ